MHVVRRLASLFTICPGKWLMPINVPWEKIVQSGKREFCKPRAAAKHARCQACKWVCKQREKPTFMMWMSADFLGSICSGKISYQPEALSTSKALFSFHYWEPRILSLHQRCGLCSRAHLSHLLLSPSGNRMPLTLHEYECFFLSVQSSMFFPWEEETIRKGFRHEVNLWLMKTRGMEVNTESVF